MHQELPIGSGMRSDNTEKKVKRESCCDSRPDRQKIKLRKGRIEEPYPVIYEEPSKEGDRGPWKLQL